jgi:predicted transcriptional regulator
MAKQFEAEVSSLDDYVDLFNGIFGLTKMERQIFVYLLTAGLQGQEPFSPETKKEIAEEMNRDEHYFLNGYIKNLKEKGALLPTEETGVYDFHPLLIPEGERHIIIELDWNL